MVNSRAVLFGVVFVGLSVGSFTSCKRAPSYDWQWVDLAGGEFKVSFPGKPAPEETPTKSITGGSFTSHSLKVKVSDTVAFGCTWFDDPSLAGTTVEEHLNQARDHGLAGVRGSLVSERRL